MWRHSGLGARPSAFSQRVKEEPSRRLSDLPIHRHLMLSCKGNLYSESLRLRVGQHKLNRMHIPNNADVIKASDSLTVYYEDGPSHRDVIHWLANACLEELDFVFTISAVLRFQVVGKLDRSRFAGLFGLCVCTHLCGLYQRWQ